MRRYLIAMHLLAEGEYYCFSGFDRKTFRTSSLLTITYNFRKSRARAKKKRVIAYKEFSSIRNSRGWGTVDCPERVETT